MSKHIGSQSIKFQNPPVIISAYSSVGKKEGDGPLKDYFDSIYKDEFLNEDTWEKAETKLVKDTVNGALESSGKTAEDIDYIFTGDLLNQCVATSFGIKDLNIPFFGVYGACSTMGESMSLAAMAIDGGFADYTIAATSSHFCSAEKQYRFPLEYGGVRTPTSQWTVTGSGAVVLASGGEGPKITHITTGKIVDMGVTDANNMGAAMAPSAADTLYTHFKDTGFTVSDYDVIVTGDLGDVGGEILVDLLADKGIDIKDRYHDCGSMIFDNVKQNTKAGGSGCGCSGSVFCGYFYKLLKKKRIKKMLFMPTGALMNTTTTQQGEPIMGVAHAVSIEC